MDLHIVEGDLLDQDVDVLVDAWNRNPFPWWLLVPQGVSAAIKRRAGTAPFEDLRRHGRMALGDAILTGPGLLPHKGIIHVAGIGLDWRSSTESVRLSVVNAMRIVKREGFRSVAFPLIGAGTGGGSPAEVETTMVDALARIDFDGKVIVVRYRR